MHINVEFACLCQSPWKIPVDVVSVFSLEVICVCSATRAVSAAYGQPLRFAVAGSFV